MDDKPRYVRHIASGRKHVWHPLYKEEDFEEWTDAVVDDKVVAMERPAKAKKGGLAPPNDDALRADASRRLP